MDDVTTRVTVLLVALLVAAAVGAQRRRRAGRSRAVTSGAVLGRADLGADLGSTATYLQLSSPACSPCRSVAAVLSSVSSSEPGVEHVEIDVTRRLDLARDLQVLRTPTVLVLDPRGQVVGRFSGAATEAQARAALPSTVRVSS